MRSSAYVRFGINIAFHFLHKMFRVMRFCKVKLDFCTSLMKHELDCMTVKFV